MPGSPVFKEGDVVRIDWPGSLHPDGRLARIVRWNRNGKPIVHLYACTTGTERTLDVGRGDVRGASRVSTAGADAIDALLREEEREARRAR